MRHHGVIRVVVFLYVRNKQIIYLTEALFYSYNICVASATQRFRISTIRGNVHNGTSQQGGRLTTC